MQKPDLTKGTEVLLENTKDKERKGGKLKHRWLGPYVISRDCEKGLFELQDKQGKILKQKYNSSCLKVRNHNY